MSLEQGVCRDAMDKFAIGDPVTWSHSHHGGYGYIFSIPAKVVGHGRGRTKIELKMANGDKTTRFVNECNLKPRVI